MEYREFAHRLSTNLIENKETSLEVLDLSNNQIEDKGLLHMSGALPLIKQGKICRLNFAKTGKVVFFLSAANHYCLSSNLSSKERRLSPQSVTLHAAWRNRCLQVHASLHRRQRHYGWLLSSRLKWKGHIAASMFHLRSIA